MGSQQINLHKILRSTQNNLMSSTSKQSIDTLFNHKLILDYKSISFILVHRVTLNLNK